MKTTSTTATVRSGRAATRMIVCVGMLAAISTILMLFEFPLPFLAPGFYELDFSEVPILIGAFALGPVAGVLTELVKVLLNLVVNGTQTAFVGEFANFVMGCMFVLPASLIYKMKKSRKHAVIGLAAGTARENNRFKDLVPINRHYNGTLRIVLGKGLSYFLVYVLVSFYVLHIVPRLFSLNQIGQPGSLVLFVAPYLAACIFFAMTTSIAIRNRETCMLIFVFTSVPLLFISGISWPGAAIPPFWKYVSYIFPSTFGINGFVKINNMGATLSEVAFEYKALWIQAGVYFLTTCWVYRWQILMSRKHAIERYKELKEKENLAKQMTD